MLFSVILEHLKAFKNFPKNSHLNHLRLKYFTNHFHHFIQHEEHQVTFIFPNCFNPSYF